MHGALHGVRIIDLTRVWAGPHATRMLADLGAEVIHVTSRKLVGALTVSQETARILGVYPNDEPGERHWNRNSQTNDLMRNKYDITLELDTPAGLALLKRLIAVSDVVVENYSPRVMPKFGLDYPRLHELNPKIILCSMPGYGSQGPYRTFISYGTNIDPASGLASLMGYPGEEPHMCGNAYPDPVAGLFAVGAILTALYHQRHAGQGQHIDLSQAEATTALLGEFSLGVGLNGVVPPRLGNRHPRQAPHGCYPCRGVDKWVAIAVGSDAEWQALQRVLGHPAWCDDPRFATLSGRLQHHDELDCHIAAWSREQEASQVMYVLQQAGVPAGVVVNAEELVNDPQLHARDFFWEIDHPEAGLLRYAGQPVRLSETPACCYRPAPCLGQHNEHILGGLLGLSADELAALRDQGVIGDQPLPRRS
jgi:crotonobetainyl-CoA:carnitine CoA-transferase CaiB-like acyl-CoA transferase